MKAKTKLVLCNALFVGLISLLGSLPVRLPSSITDILPNLYAGGIGFGLAFLSQIKVFLEKEISDDEHKLRKKQEKECTDKFHCEDDENKRKPPMVSFGIVYPF